MAYYSKNPCKDCVPPERRPGCHSAEKCEKWAAWEKEFGAIKQRMSDNKRDYVAPTSYAVEQGEKIRKRWRKK